MFSYPLLKNTLLNKFIYLYILRKVFNQEGKSHL